MSTPKETQQQKQDRMRREALLVLLALCIADARSSLHSLAAQIATGKLTPGGFGLNAAAVLTGAHAQAISLGTSIAGFAPYQGVDNGDLAAALSVMQGQRDYLNGFVSDIQGGRYTDDKGKLKESAVMSRSDLYAFRLRGSAYEGWVMAHPVSTLFWWRLGTVEKHCRQCPELEANSPYKRDALPTYPAAGGTDCGSNCDCDLMSDLGGQGVPSVRDLLNLLG